MVKLRVVARHEDLATVLRPHLDVYMSGGQHLGVLAVDRATHRVAAGPAHPVACA